MARRRRRPRGDFCEAARSGAIKQRSNTLPNLGFVVAGPGSGLLTPGQERGHELAADDTKVGNQGSGAASCGDCVAR